MILVDTSIWVDHLRTGEPMLAGLLDRGEVLMHPWVVGELVLGYLPADSEWHSLLTSLRQAPVATTDEVLALVRRHALRGSGIGYVDAQLLAATKLVPGTGLWTRDKRLADAASRLGVAATSTAVAEELDAD